LILLFHWWDFVKEQASLSCGEELVFVTPLHRASDDNAILIAPNLIRLALSAVEGFAIKKGDQSGKCSSSEPKKCADMEESHDFVILFLI